MKKRLLAILAHPDDETLGIGGTLAKYASEGVDCHVAIATDGAAGSVIDNFDFKSTSLIKVRDNELSKAAKILGVTIHKLNFRDSGYVGDPANGHKEAFINVDREKIVKKISNLIKDIRPDVVITHDATGEYFHPDHICCCECVTEAFDYLRNGKLRYKPKKLYYHVIPKYWINLYVFSKIITGQNPKKTGRNKDIDITKLGVTKKDITTVIDIADFFDTKKKASEMHESQGGKNHKLKQFPVFIQKTILGKEYFVSAFPRKDNKVKEDSLFN